MGRALVDFLGDEAEGAAEFNGKTDRVFRRLGSIEPLAGTVAFGASWKESLVNQLRTFDRPSCTVPSCGVATLRASFQSWLMTTKPSIADEAVASRIALVVGKMRSSGHGLA